MIQNKITVDVLLSVNTFVIHMSLKNNHPLIHLFTFGFIDVAKHVTVTPFIGVIFMGWFFVNYGWVETNISENIWAWTCNENSVTISMSRITEYLLAPKKIPLKFVSSYYVLVA